MTASLESATDPRFLTPREAAGVLRVTPRTIYLWIQSGKLQAVRVSERVTRIPHSEVERLLGTGGQAASVSRTPSDSESSLPDLASVLWDLDPEQVDWDSHARLIIGRILEAGRPAQLRWMMGRYPIELVLDVAEHARGLSHCASVAWSTLLRDRLNRVA